MSVALAWKSAAKSNEKSDNQNYATLLLFRMSFSSFLARTALLHWQSIWKAKVLFRFEFLGWAFKTKKKKRETIFVCALIKNWAHFLMKNPTINKVLSPDLIFFKRKLVCPKNAANKIIRGFQLDHTKPQSFAKCTPFSPLMCQLIEIIKVSELRTGSD